MNSFVSIGPARLRPATIRRRFAPLRAQVWRSGKARWIAASAAILVMSCIAGGYALRGSIEAAPGVALDAERQVPVKFSVPAVIAPKVVKLDRSASGRYAAMEAADIARHDYQDYFGPEQLAPGQSVWRAGVSEPAALRIVVSIADQRLYLYEGPFLIAASSVSTGRPGHPTPAGIFPIIEKYELRLSNLYDDAPMPHMQRLTMDGIALHAGHVPGFPASHGCVRLPPEFAERLFEMTSNGTPVLIAA